MTREGWYTRQGVDIVLRATAHGEPKASELQQSYFFRQRNDDDDDDAYINAKRRQEQTNERGGPTTEWGKGKNNTTEKRSGIHAYKRATGWYRASCSRGPRRGAHATVEPAHLALEPLDARRAVRAAHTVLVEQIRQQVLLLVRQALEQHEQVRLVAEDELGGDDDGGGGFAHHEGRRIVECLPKYE